MQVIEIPVNWHPTGLRGFSVIIYYYILVSQPDLDKEPVMIKHLMTTILPLTTYD